MKIWLVTTGEPLPGESGARLWRTGLLAETLSHAGHDVVWWTSSFDHARKRQRAAADLTIEIRPTYRIKLLRSPGYRANVSLSRVIDHLAIARRFTAASARETPPAVILCSLPTLDLCVATTAYGERFGVPVVLDVRDLWPDIMVEIAPPVLRPIAHAALLPMRRQAAWAGKRAAAITGVTDEFVDWGLRFANRPRTPLDRAFSMAYPSNSPDPAALAAAEAFWEEHRVPAETDEFIVCFLGTLGRQFELEPVLAAAKQLEASGRRFRFVICGSGERESQYRAMAEGCASVVFPGWVDATAMWALLRRSRVGLAPYVYSPNFLMNIPNKPIEYLSAGLPILTNLQGTLGRLIAQHDCGMSYDSSADALVAALIEMESSPARLREQAANARRLYESTFRADVVYPEMGRYLERVAQSHQPTTARSLA